MDGVGSGQKESSSDQRIAQLERRVEGLERLIEVGGVTSAPGVAPAPPPPPPPRQPIDWGAERRSFDLDSLLSTRTLAWVGGVVLLLGMALFVAIAVDRGWINEQARVVLGVAFSSGLLGAAVLLRNNYGRTEAGLVAAGAGIAGLFFSDLAAGPLYELISDPVTLALACLIAALAIVIAIAWDYETIAVVGLAGAIGAAPEIVGEVTLAGLSVVGLALVASIVLSVLRRWNLVVLLSVALSLPQALIWVAVYPERHLVGVLITLGFWALTAGAGLALELRRGRDDLGKVPAYLIGAATLFVLTGLLVAVNGRSLGVSADGLALAGPALAYLIVTAVLWNAGGRRDLRTLLGGAGLLLVGIATFICFDDRLLSAALAIEISLLAWAGLRLKEERLGVASLVYLGAALSYLFYVEAKPELLFDDSANPGIEMLSVAAIAAGAAVPAVFAPPKLRQVAAWACGGLLVYLGSLAIVALLSSPDSNLDVFATTSTSFQSAQTVVSIFWGCVGLGLIAVGLTRRLPALRTGGFVLLAVALAKAFLFDLSALTAFARALSFLGLGVLLLVAAVVHQRLSRSVDGPAVSGPDSRPIAEGH